MTIELHFLQVTTDKKVYQSWLEFGDQVLQDATFSGTPSRANLKRLKLQRTLKC